MWPTSLPLPVVVAQQVQAIRAHGSNGFARPLEKGTYDTDGGGAGEAQLFPRPRRLPWALCTGTKSAARPHTRTLVLPSLSLPRPPSGLLGPSL